MLPRISNGTNYLLGSFNLSHYIIVRLNDRSYIPSETSRCSTGRRKIMQSKHCQTILRMTNRPQSGGVMQLPFFIPLNPPINRPQQKN